MQIRYNQDIKSHGVIFRLLIPENIQHKYFCNIKKYKKENSILNDHFNTLWN